MDMENCLVKTIKYCRFLESLQDGEEIIFEKDKEYKIISENEDTYFFGKSGIAKKYENNKFKIIIYVGYANVSDEEIISFYTDKGDR